MSRESTSRPARSVPSRCSALGGLALNLTARSGTAGSHGAMTGANTATSTITTMTVSARMLPGSRRSRRLAIAQVDSPRRDGLMASGSVRGNSVIANPRVDGGVKQVDKQVGDDEQHGGVDDERQHDRQVAVQERHKAVAAHAGNVEYELRKIGAVNERGQVEADDGDDGNHDVAHRVLPGDCPLLHALGAGRADVVLADCFKERRAGDAGDERGGARAEHEGGQQVEFQAAVTDAGLGNPAPLENDDQDDYERVPEDGHADARERQEHGEAVKQAVLLQG